MQTRTEQSPVVLDSKTAQPVTGPNAYRARGTGRGVPDEEKDPGSKVPAHSPDGRAAHSELKPKGLLILMVSVLLTVIVASGLVATLWSIPAGLLVLVFGTGLLFLGNPAIWAAGRRSKERTDEDKDQGS